MDEDDEEEEDEEVDGRGGDGGEGVRCGGEEGEVTRGRGTLTANTGGVVDGRVERAQEGEEEEARVSRQWERGRLDAGVRGRREVRRQRRVAVAVSGDRRDRTRRDIA